MNKRKIEILTGWAIILMAFLAAFSIGYALSLFKQPENIEVLKYQIQNKRVLYLSMLIGLFVILLLDLCITYTLYKYFVTVNKKISFIAGILRMLYTVIFGLAIYFLLINVLNNKLTNLQISQNFESFEYIWNASLLIFGLHLGFIGYLMMLANVIKALVYLMFFAGASYIIVHSLKLIALEDATLTSLEMFLSFPMAIGEIGFAIWLLLKRSKPIYKS